MPHGGFLVSRSVPLNRASELGAEFPIAHSAPRLSQLTPVSVQTSTALAVPGMHSA